MYGVQICSAEHGPVFLWGEEEKESLSHSGKSLG